MDEMNNQQVNKQQINGKSEQQAKSE